MTPEPKTFDNQETKTRNKINPNHYKTPEPKSRWKISPTYSLPELKKPPLNFREIEDKKYKKLVSKEI